MPNAIFQRADSAAETSLAHATLSQTLTDLGDWRGATLARLRRLIRESDADIVEEVKWRKPTNPAGVPVWSQDGIICTGETYRNTVKMTFARGAALSDWQRGPAKVTASRQHW